MQICRTLPGGKLQRLLLTATSDTVFICCPGPSLKDVDASALKGSSANLLAVNNAWPKIHPDVWVGADGPLKFAPGLLEAGFKIISCAYGDVVYNGKQLQDYPTFHQLVAPGWHLTPYDLFHRCGRYDGVAVNFPRGKRPSSAKNIKRIFPANSFVLALHIAASMRPKRIGLVGCDFGRKSGLDYHDGKVSHLRERKYNQGLYGRCVSRLGECRAAAHDVGIELISCTPDSPANKHLTYIAVDEAILSCRHNAASG